MPVGFQTITHRDKNNKIWRIQYLARAGNLQLDFFPCDKDWLMTYGVAIFVTPHQAAQVIRGIADKITASAIAKGCIPY